MEVYKDVRMRIEEMMVVMYNLDMTSCVCPEINIH
jgi:hypothetical protein